MSDVGLGRPGGFDARQILVSCEHASNRLPEGLEAPPELMDLHIAYDPGARDIAERLAAMFEAPLHLGEYSRLVVDLNRTIGNSRLIRRRSAGHSIPFNRGLDAADVRRRIDRYYRPYREAVADDVRRIVRRRGRCVHLCVHTFTPVFQGTRRGNDIGLLYDPARRPEAEATRELRHRLRLRTGLVVWLNRPYQGTADGILPRIREQHPEGRYVGIELEVNQRFAGAPGELRSIADHFGHAVAELEALWGR